MKRFFFSDLLLYLPPGSTIARYKNCIFSLIFWRIFIRFGVLVDLVVVRLHHISYGFHISPTFQADNYHWFLCKLDTDFPWNRSIKQIRDFPVFLLWPAGGTMAKYKLCIFSPNILWQILKFVHRGQLMLSIQRSYLGWKASCFVFWLLSRPYFLITLPYDQMKMSCWLYFACW